MYMFMGDCKFAIEKEDEEREGEGCEGGNHRCGLQYVMYKALGEYQRAIETKFDLHLKMS